MNHDEVLDGMLSILDEQYQKYPPFFVASSMLRSRLNTPVEQLRPYAENLEELGYAQKLEGLAPTFIVKFTERGHKAYQQHKL